MDKTIGQLTKKTEQMNYENYIALHLVLTRRSKLNIIDKDVACSMRCLEIRTWRKSTISRAKKCGVTELFLADFFQ